LAGLNVPPGFRTTTIESKTNIFRACGPGRLTGVALPVHVGRRTIVLGPEGIGGYRKRCAEITAKGYEGFILA
jgi:acyl-coenzyme A thioesterase PaaI-like protein